MTDPIQTGDPQQQGQQWYTDDILWWEDIFAAIPKAALEKEDIPYGELLEKKYQFAPTPEVEVPAVQVPSVQVPVEPISTVQVTPPVQVAKAVEVTPPAPVVQTPVVKEEPIVQEKITPPLAPIVAPITPTPTPPMPKVEQQAVTRPAVVTVPPTIQAPKIAPAPTVTIPKEEIKKPVIQAAPSAPIVPPVQAKPLPEEAIPPTVVEEKIPVIEKVIPAKELPVENILETKLQTDVQKKFGELFFITKKIYQLKDKLWITEETFDILWADNDKIFISYRFLLDETDEPILFISKIEQDKETQEETANELRFTFNEETSSLEVMINDTLLFDEVEDFTEDQKKKLQVVDKINKFTFLASEELRKIEKEIKEKEEAELERKKLQEIFRNF